MGFLDLRPSIGGRDERVLFRDDSIAFRVREVDGVLPAGAFERIRRSRNRILLLKVTFGPSDGVGPFGSGEVVVAILLILRVGDRVVAGGVGERQFFGFFVSGDRDEAIPFGVGKGVGQVRVDPPVFGDPHVNCFFPTFHKRADGCRVLPSPNAERIQSVGMESGVASPVLFGEVVFRFLISPVLLHPQIVHFLIISSIVDRSGVALSSRPIHTDVVVPIRIIPSSIVRLLVDQSLSGPGLSVGEHTGVGLEPSDDAPFARRLVEPRMGLVVSGS
ncbi:MAG: hypothetical protein ACRC1K_24385 [Planctomycetia bacterium]